MREKTLLQLGEEARRKHAIGDRAVIELTDAAAIWARPGEGIAFGIDGPAALTIEAKVSFEGGWKF